MKSMARRLRGSDGVGPRFESIKPGDPVRVFYDPHDPRLSLLGTSSPLVLFRDTIIVSAVFSTIVGCMATLGLLGIRFGLFRR